MDYTEYVERLRARAAAAGLEAAEYGTVVEAGKRYPLLKLTLPSPPPPEPSSPARPRVTITSGFHGEEPAGPLTLLSGVAEIAACARDRGVGLAIYPCVNPSGFEAGTRYNRSGEKPNNDLLRYEVEPGVFRGELRPGETFLRWVPFAGGPKETRALVADLDRAEAPAAALDIHQDAEVRGPATYAYIFGDRAAYRPLQAAAARHAHVIANHDVGAGAVTDGEGFIVLHDGSVSDYFLRRGSAYVAVIETTVDTPLEACLAIHLIWIRGFVDLAAGAP